MELSKKLKELKVKQESLWCWFLRHTNAHWMLLDKTVLCKYHNKDSEYYSAFTVAEVGEILPVPYINMLGKSRYGYWNSNNKKFDVGKCDTEANAKTKMLIYLIENKLIKVEDL